MSKAEEKLLNAIHKNVQMGVFGIDDILPSNKDEKFKKLLEEQKKEYETILFESEKLAAEYGFKAEDIPKTAEISSGIMSKIKTLASSSPEHLARMMNEGTNKGIAEMISVIREYPKADSAVLNLAEQTLKTEQKNMQDINRFL